MKAPPLHRSSLVHLTPLSLSDKKKQKKNVVRFYFLVMFFKSTFPIYYLYHQIDILDGMLRLMLEILDHWCVLEAEVNWC